MDWSGHEIWKISHFGHVPKMENERIWRYLWSMKYGKYHILTHGRRRRNRRNRNRQIDF